MDEELRCGYMMHGILRGENLIEVKCKRRPCGAKPGVVVLHTFNLTTGKLVGTVRFRDPVRKGN